MSSVHAAFWVDRDYDREHASDGISCYGAYLRDATLSRGPMTTRRWSGLCSRGGGPPAR